MQSIQFLTSNLHTLAALGASLGAGLLTNRIVEEVYKRAIVQQPNKSLTPPIPLAVRASALGMAAYITVKTMQVSSLILAVPNPIVYAGIISLVLFAGLCLQQRRKQKEINEPSTEPTEPPTKPNAPIDTKGCTTLSMEQLKHKYLDQIDVCEVSPKQPLIITGIDPKIFQDAETEADKIDKIEAYLSTYMIIPDAATISFKDDQIKLESTEASPLRVVGTRLSLAQLKANCAGGKMPEISYGKPMLIKCESFDFSCLDEFKMSKTIRTELSSDAETSGARETIINTLLNFITIEDSVRIIYVPLTRIVVLALRKGSEPVKLTSKSSS